MVACGSSACDTQLGQFCDAAIGTCSMVRVPWEHTMGRVVLPVPAQCPLGEEACGTTCCEAGEWCLAGQCQSSAAAVQG